MLGSKEAEHWEDAYCPSWYVLFRGGGYQSLPPHERAEMPMYWLTYAMAVEQVETEATNERAEREQKLAEMRRKLKGH